jgi:hypothetical protein
VLCFGSRGFSRVWITVASFLNWLHTYFGGGRTHVYVDDHFGLDAADAMTATPADTCLRPGEAPSPSG